MWPFASRTTRQASTARLPADILPADLFAQNDAVLKVWLPEALSNLVSWLSIESGASRPDVVRALLYQHVYGQVAYEHLKAHAVRNLSPDHGSDIVQSRSRDTHIDIEFFGKSLDDFKLHLPSRLKTDLASIAKEHRLTSSHYVRKLLVQQLMGERVHANWQAAIGKLGPDVDRLERDEA